MALSIGEQARWWSIGLAVMVAFFWALGDSLLPYLAGAALAYFLDPIADRLEALGLSRISATAVITLIMAGIFILALLFLIPALAKQFRELAEQLSGLRRRRAQVRRAALPGAVPGGIDARHRALDPARERQELERQGA